MKPISRRSFLERSGTGIAVATAIPALEVPLPQLKSDEGSSSTPARTARGFKKGLTLEMALQNVESVAQAAQNQPQS